MRNLFTILLLLLSLSALAQNGIIKGKVTDATTGEEIIGANVTIEGTAIGASSSITGDYQFSAAPGSYTIRTSYIGYKEFKKAGVVVNANETTVLNIVIAEDVEALTEVVVVAKADKASENILLMERKNASIAIESIGSRELSARGVSDVKAGLVKMSGVSQASSSKGVYVRGLGDRYNNAYLNGLPLPSPDPNLKVINLDLFPTSIVRNIDVSKTYNVDQFGDMSGASVNILTKDAAEEDYLSFGLGVNYNTQASFNNFLVNRTGAGGYFGFAANQRQSPTALNSQTEYQFSEATAQDPFTTAFSPKQISAPLDNSYNLQAGKHFNFGASKLGITLAGVFNNNYRMDEGINDNLDAQQNPVRDFYRTRYRYETNLTGLVGAQYSLSNKHYVNVNYLFINNSANHYIASQGNTFDDENPDVYDLRRLRSRYVETNLQDVQLITKHEFSDKLNVRWGGSYAKATTDEPDRLDLSFQTLQGVTTEGVFSAPNTDQNQRYFQLTDENEMYGFAEASYGLGTALANTTQARHKIVVGYQFKNKERVENFRSFRFLPGLGQEEVVQFDQLNTLFTDAAYASGNYTYVDAGDASNEASAERLIHSGYAYANLSLGSRLTVIPGIRAEYTDQAVYFKRLGDGYPSKFRDESINKVDFLPALNLKYNINDQRVVRAAFTKTLTRPNFRELVPVPFVDENLRSFTGNPLLINSGVYNADVKFDIYPQAGELLSIGAFYKYIDNPIELVQDGVNFIKPFNIPSATAYGLEIEASKRFSNIFNSSSQLVEGLLIDANVTLMLTDIVADDESIANDKKIPEADKRVITNLTEDSRTLQGASPYLVNFSLGYDNLLFNNSEESNIRLTYNRFGKRIYAAGTTNLGDIYELSYGTLDFVIQNTWKSGFGVKISAKNLLNPAIRLEQNAGPVATQGATLIQSYQAGMNFGLGLTYRLGFGK